VTGSVGAGVVTGGVVTGGVVTGGVVTGGVVTGGVVGGGVVGGGVVGGGVVGGFEVCGGVLVDVELDGYATCTGLGALPAHAGEVAIRAPIPIAVTASASGATRLLVMMPP
jgi:hypothetical protein